LKDIIGTKIREDLNFEVSQKKVLHDIQRERIKLEREVITDNVHNEVNSTLLNMFDYLNHPDPKCNMKYEAF